MENNILKNLQINQNANKISIQKFSSQNLPANKHVMKGNGKYTAINYNDSLSIFDNTQSIFASIHQQLDFDQIIQDFDFFPYNQQYIASVSDSIQILKIPHQNTRKMKPIHTLKQQFQLNSCSFNNQVEGLLAATSSDYSLRIYDLIELQEIFVCQQEQQDSHADSLAWDIMGDLIVSAWSDQIIRVSDPRTSQFQTLIKSSLLSSKCSLNNQVLFKQNGNIVIASQSGTCMIYDHRKTDSPIISTTLTNEGCLNLSYDENLDIFWVTHKNSNQIQSYNSDLTQQLTTHDTPDPYLDTYFLPSHYLKLSQNEVANCMVLEKDHIGGVSFVKDQNYLLYPKIQTNYGLNIDQWQNNVANQQKQIMVEQLEGNGFDNREIEFQLSKQLNIIKASTQMYDSQDLRFQFKKNQNNQPGGVWLPQFNSDPQIPDNDDNDYEFEKQNLYKLISIFLVLYLQKKDQQNISQFMEQILQEKCELLSSYPKNKIEINQDNHGTFAKILHNIIYFDNQQSNKKAKGSISLDTVSESELSLQNPLQDSVQNPFENSVQNPLEDNSMQNPLGDNSILNPMDEKEGEEEETGDILYKQMHNDAKNPMENDSEEQKENIMYKGAKNPMEDNQEEHQEKIFNPMEDDKTSEQSELITKPTPEVKPQVYAVQGQAAQSQEAYCYVAPDQAAQGQAAQDQAIMVQAAHDQETHYQLLLEQKDKHYQNEIWQLRSENQALKSQISQVSQLEFQRQQQIEMIQSRSKSLEIKNWQQEIKLSDQNLKQYPPISSHQPHYILNYID